MRTSASRIAHLLVAAVIAMGLLHAPSRAQVAPPSAMPPGFYRATAIVTGTDNRQRPAGFADCLLQVLLRLTGAPRIRGNGAVAAVLAKADTLVDHFSYVDPRAALLHHDDQGTYDRPHELTVWFRPASVDAAIARLGLNLWRGPRPLLVPIVLVRTREPDPYLLSAEAPQGAAMRAALGRIAAEDGIGVHFPTADELAEWGVDTIGPPNPLPASVQSGRVIVTGSLSFNVKEMGWTGDWTEDAADGQHHWEVHGVSFDDAFRTMVDGAVELAAGTGTP